MSDSYVRCMGDYELTRIAAFAKKRYVDGVSTVALMNQARCETEREEIALVCLLDVEDSEVRNLKLSCKYADKCQIENCRDVLRKLIQDLMSRH